MRLARLAIRSLPGIEPGFAFEPPGPGVNVVTGPNAIGKSSLARALGYLLASERSDPPALSLEAELESGGDLWQVQRNGSQIVWRYNGEVAARPALPAADQIGRYRLSIENLLDDDDASDRELAEGLRRELHGNFDLEALRDEVGPRFARHEAKALDDARSLRRRIENDYDALRRREAELPELERRIDEARDAERRCRALERALELAAAAAACRACEEALARFPPDMDRLHGDEPEQIDLAEKKLRSLRDDLREQQRMRAEARSALEGSVLSQSLPDPDDMQAIAAKLRTLDRLGVDRRNVRRLLAQAEAEVKDALRAFNDAGVPPRLDADALRRAEAVASPLIAARTRLRDLREELALAGEAPDESDLARQREGVEALRAWLAAHAAGSKQGTGPARSSRIAAWAALVAAALAALAAFLQGAMLALAGALAALVASGLGVLLGRIARNAGPPAADEAARRFVETGIEAPPRWDETTVRGHLRERVEARLNELTLRRQRAAGRDRVALQIGEAETEIEGLEKESSALAEEIGFDPGLPVAAFDRFVHQCSRWDEARKRQDEHGTAAGLLDREIADTAKGVGAFLERWREGGPPKQEDVREHPDADFLNSAFESLQQRIEAARAAKSEIGNRETAIRALEDRIADAAREREGLFVRVGLAPEARAELGPRIGQLPQWKEAASALERARTEQDLIRARLGEQPELIALAEEDRRAELRGELEPLSLRAGELASLIEQRTVIRTRLTDAGKDLALEKAAAAESRAEQILADRRDEALLAAATDLLIEDLEQAFIAEHEPAVLRRARAIFTQVTARAFDLRLRPDGSFAARDLRQGAERELGELSSGTRAQMLLALRLAWTEVQEEGGESLPLFLDEALTTSDEDRFAVMARSLERIASDEGRPRQVFYLSARRHESVLWERATGTEPATVDLAAIRFPGRAMAPEEYGVENAPPLPTPEDHSAESYASVLGVPLLDPHRPVGGVHPFYILRDDLPLLHALVDTWRITSLGQLEALLASDAAPAALAGEELRERLAGRSRALRTWADLWRQGRGSPMDRGVLEQCDAVSAVFIDRADELAKRVGGDGEAFLEALRDGELGHFRLNKMEELERELIDEGCIDVRERLDGEERRRLTLQRMASQAPIDAGDVNRVVGWLESAAGGAGPRAPAESNGTSLVEAS